MNTPATYLLCIRTRRGQRQAVAAVTFPDDNACCVAAARAAFSRAGFDRHLGTVQLAAYASKLQNYRGKAPDFREVSP